VQTAENGARDLVLWSKDGHDLGRSHLDIAGEITAAGRVPATGRIS
jgi:hypothetical protein